MTSCKGLFRGPNDDVVTWPSAFWAITPIAMNSMLQPNGMVLKFRSAWGITLRSSPMVCLFDALDLIFSWITLTFFCGESPCVAAKRIARGRFRDVDNDDSEQSLKSLRKHFWLVQVIFIICTVTQAVKLFACQGIAGTQFCAGFYILSYIASEALIWAAGDDWKTAELPTINSDLVNEVALQGLLPWIPFHIFGVLFHYAWIGDLFLSPLVVEPYTGIEAFFVKSTLIALTSIVPVILMHTDSPRLFQLSANERRYFILILILEHALEYAWRFTVPLNECGEPLLGSGALPGGLVLFVDQAAAAFDRSSRGMVVRAITVLSIWSVAAYWLVRFILRSDFYDVSDAIFWAL